MRLRSFDEDPGRTLGALVSSRTFQSGPFGAYATVVSPHEVIQQRVELRASWKVDRERQSRLVGHEHVSSLESHRCHGRTAKRRGVHIALSRTDAGFHSEHSL